jgi:hypothetical protein
VPGRTECLVEKVMFQKALILSYNTGLNHPYGDGNQINVSGASSLLFIEAHKKSLKLISVYKIKGYLSIYQCIAIISFNIDLLCSCNLNM